MTHHTADEIREQLLHAIDHAYTTGVLGYTSPEDLLAAYDTSRTPATDRAELRDRIAQAIEDAPFRPDTRRSLQLADAVLAVLPSAADRAAVLREAADQIDAGWFTTAASVTAELRRMADETATQTPTEVIHACPPDGSGLTPCCGQTPFELPRTDRISSEAPTTCTGPVAGARQDGAQR